MPAIDSVPEPKGAVVPPVVHARVPPFRVTPPENVFDADSVRIPDPDTVSGAVPEINPDIVGVNVPVVIVVVPFMVSALGNVPVAPSVRVFRYVVICVVIWPDPAALG